MAQIQIMPRFEQRLIDMPLIVRRHVDFIAEFTRERQPDYEGFGKADGEGPGDAFEPDGETFTQYFFVAREDFAAAGLRSEVAAAIEKRLANFSGECGECGAPATWQWISRREVSSLDQTERIEESPGAMYCAKHGAAKLREALSKIQEANLFYVNAPYGDSGAYVWI